MRYFNFYYYSIEWIFQTISDVRQKNFGLKISFAISSKLEIAKIVQQEETRWRSMDGQDSSIEPGIFRLRVFKLENYQISISCLI